MTAREKAAAQAEATRLAESLGISDPDEILELVALGFETPDTSAHHRLIVSSSAKEKTGKTHFSIATTPEPIAFIDFDVGTEGVIEKFPRRKMIHKKFQIRKEKMLAGDRYTQADAEADWTAVQEVIRACVRSKAIKTLVVDTATELWEVARLSEFGKLDQVKSHHYGPVNAEFRNIIQAPYMRSDINVIYTHKVKKEYKNDTWKGGYERAGFGDMPFLAQVNIEHYRVSEMEDEDRPFAIKIINCRQNADMEGEELIGPMCTFANLGRMVFPGSSKEDWK